MAPIRRFGRQRNLDGRHLIGHGFEPMRIAIRAPAPRQGGGDGQGPEQGRDDRNWTGRFCGRHKHDPSAQTLRSGASTGLSEKVNRFIMTNAAPSPSPLAVVRTVADLRATVRDWKRQGLSVGMVPTMGALHEGHLTLVREAARRADRVVASNFVNPTQFAAHEDLDKYPRQQEQDARLLAGAGCHLMFAPSAQEMYPEGFATSIAVAGPALGLEGDFRPQMFGGVALVVTKLFNQVQPDIAVFGEKDYQQLMVIRRFVRDLDLPIKIVGAPTERDAHGLALSSRNAYLSETELASARRLNRILAQAGADAASGRLLPDVEREAYAALLKAGFERVDYVAIRRAEDLGVFRNALVDAPARILAAAWLGTTRLIDNMAVCGKEAPQLW